MDTKSIFKFECYKLFLRDWIAAHGKRRGGVSRLAEAIKVHPSFISQILNMDKHLSQEQAFKVGDFLGLRELERDYFLLLTLEAKSGTQRLKIYYQGKLRKIREQAKTVSANVGQAKRLSEKARARFYSDPSYSLIRLLTSIDGFNDGSSISETLRLPLSYVLEVLDFLVEHDLCRYSEESGYSLGKKSTHLSNKSPFILSHHRNWRNKAIELFASMDDEDLAFSAPLTLSSKDFSNVREKILALIRDATKVVAETEKEEEFVVFNVDWLRLKQ